VPEQSAALALATFQSLLRAPEVKMAWASSFFVTIILGATFFFRDPSHLSDSMKPSSVTGSIVFPVFFLAQFFANQFGFDRDGFRALILSPADRRLILLGKNLATLPVGATFGGLLLVLASVWLHLPLPDVAATVFQLVTVLLIVSLVGNLLSILNPFRIRSGSMKPTKMPGLAMVVLLLCQMFLPLTLAPVFFPQSSRPALARDGPARCRAHQPHPLRAALRTDRHSLLADARAHGPPAATAAKPKSRRRFGGGGIKFPQPALLPLPPKQRRPHPHQRAPLPHRRLQSSDIPIETPQRHAKLRASASRVSRNAQSTAPPPRDPRSQRRHRHQPLHPQRRALQRRLQQPRRPAQSTPNFAGSSPAFTCSNTGSTRRVGSP